MYNAYNIMLWVHFRKKSIENIPSDDTILNQYMYTYGKENELENEVNEVNNDLKDDKLVWLEDKLIDNALKYTGANQGTKDPEEIDNVKNQVLANLNQAYNIEKLRQENNNEMQGKRLHTQYMDRFDTYNSR